MSSPQLGQEVCEVKSNADLKYKLQIKWINIVLLTILHCCALYGLYLLLTACRTETVFAWFIFGALSGMGITAGAHRLWSHRAYKAKVPLRVILMLLNSMALQNDIYVWCRDHRMHHKFSETNADPHNSNRGFFFAHMGWLMCKKHPEVLNKAKTMDFSDLLKDPVVTFQRRFYFPLAVTFCFALPTLVPVYLWNENVWNSLFVCAFLRYCYTLHCTWFVNSVAHMFGMRQYDKSINPRESALVVYSSYGEGYHNYHHVFPFDYSASELDWRYNFNFSTFFIDCFAKIGWAYDLRRVTPQVIDQRVQRTGDIDLHKNIVNEKYRDNPARTIALATCHLWVPLGIRLFTMNHGHISSYLALI